MRFEVDSNREVAGEGVHVDVVDSNRKGTGGDDVAYVHNLVVVEGVGRENEQGDRSCGYHFDVLLAFHLERELARRKTIFHFLGCRCWKMK